MTKKRMETADDEFTDAAIDKVLQQLKTAPQN